jgi:hypothetical protein
MRYKKLAVFAVVLLLSCGALAAFYVLLSDWIVFTVENQSGAPLAKVEVMIGETAHPVGDIDAGDRARVVVGTLPDCSPHLKYTLGSTVHDTDLETYLTTGMKGTLRITVKPDELVVEEDVMGHWVRTISTRPASGGAKGANKSGS